MTAALIGPFGRTVIGPTKVTIGRAPDNTIVLSDPRVSSHHAEVRPEGAYFSVVDLGSSNGTFVNEQQVSSGAPRLLQPGDTLRIADTKFMFEIENVPQPYVGGSTMGAIPPPPPPAFGATPNIAGSTSYGMSDYGDYQGTIPAQSAYTPPRQPASPYSSETQIPTYISSSGQQPLYTPPQQAGQQPSYTPPPFYTPPSQPPPPKPSPVRTIVLAVIALVIILAGIGGFFVIQHNQQVYNMTQTATASAIQLETSATAAAAQATAHAQATVQAMNATATAIVTSHYPPFTKVALFNTLTSSTSTWDSGTICQFGSSGYMVSIQQAHTLQYCLNNSGQFGEIAYQVTLTVQQGDCGGLVFRYVDTKDFYFMDVCQDGSYDIGDYGNGTENLRYNSTQPSSAIIQGTGKQNVIAITVQGNTVNVYINGQSVDSITSQALTASPFNMGQVGLLADDLGNPTAVSFTNAIVWTAQ
jgi:hypothetical protein